jgi:hypothetical protein
MLCYCFNWAQPSTNNPSLKNRRRKKEKIGKEKSKISLFVDNFINYIENARKLEEGIARLPERRSIFKYQYCSLWQ